jgi:hypothetical protein
MAMVKLRGVFNPAVHVAIALAMIAVTFSVVSGVRRDAQSGYSAQWAPIDLRLVPVALALGLIVGYPIGKKRLQLLLRVLPELDNKFFLGERSVLGKSREGENVMMAQRIAYAIAFVAPFLAATYSNGRIMFWGCPIAFILGAFLTGKTIPVLRLWMATRHSL